MTNTYNTGNQLGSTDPRDASDNASNFDEFANSAAATYTDRFGKQRHTMTGALQDYAAYNSRGVWTTATAYNVNDVWRDGPSGAFYLVLADYTSGATAAADIAGGNVAVHQPKDWVVSVATIADLRALEPAFDGQQVELLGHTVAGVGGGMFYHDTSDTTTADDNGVTIVTAGGKRWKRRLNGFVTPEMFGYVSSLNDTAVQSALNCSESFYFSGTYIVDDISIPAGKNFSGSGSFYGSQSLGTKPDIAALDATTTPAERLALLSIYTQSRVNIEAGTYKTSLALNNLLILGTGDRVFHLKLDLNDCAVHGGNLVAKFSGEIDAPGLISSDSSGYAVMANFGGVASIPDSIIYKSGNTSVYVRTNGAIEATNTIIRYSANNGLQVNGNGSITAQNSDIRYSNSQNVAVTYSGNINVGFSHIEGAINGAGVVAESNGSVYAEGCTVINNNLWGLTTSYNGFIQAKNSVVTGNGRAISTITGGVIQILGAEVHDNNGGASAVQVDSKALGFIITEPAGTPSSGKDTLTDAQYNPPYGVMGQGMGMVYNGESGGAWPNDSVGISISRVYRPKAYATVSGVSLTVSAPFMIVNTNAAPVTIENISLASGFSSEEIYIQAFGANSLTVQTGTGNIRTPAAITIPSVNAVIKLIKTGNVDRWTVERDS